MLDESTRWYELVKHNFDNPDPRTTEVVVTVRGLAYAQQLAEVLTKRLTPEEKAAGFAVFQQEGSKPLGIKKARKTPAR